MIAITDPSFTDEQKQYLAGFFAGSGIARSFTGQSKPGPASSDGAARPEDIHLQAQDRFTAQGKTLCNEELAKRKTHGLDVWDQVLEHARDAKFPKGTDVFLFKFQGLFYVAPAQDSFMCRLRFPAGVVTSHQLRGLADLGQRHAGGYADVTTRANLQFREIGPAQTVELLMGLHELGIINRGAGADNMRNITASPTSGFDPQELYDVRPLARQLHHYILNHRELYGLPRKFNVAFDSGGSVSVLENTNDIGFAAVRVSDEKAKSHDLQGGVYFRVLLAGITGHRQFAADAGLLLKPDECMPTAVAIIKAFIEHGDRTDRKKARLKYLVDRMGMDGFLAEVQKHLRGTLRRASTEACEPRPIAVRGAHIGAHSQKQPETFYLGVIAPAARVRADQLRVLADIAQECGAGEVRLTVWQNILIPHIPAAKLSQAKKRIEQAGLSWAPTAIRAGIVACTGNGGCKYAASDTKRHALQIANHIEASGLKIDQPLNVHLTGCPHSCAQHYIGDIGLLGTKIGDDAVEGYHLYVGGGAGAEQQIAAELMRDIAAENVPRVIEQILRVYMERRQTESEPFIEFVRRHGVEDLRALFDDAALEAAKS